ERKQQMQNDGLDTAVFRLGDKQSEDSLEINVQTTVVLGPKIDEGQLKQDIAGKKRGDVENIVKRLNGIKDVEVTYSPFWVSITPKNTSKITVEYEEAVNQ